MKTLIIVIGFALYFLLVAALQMARMDVTRYATEEEYRRHLQEELDEYLLIGVLVSIALLL